MKGAPFCISNVVLAFTESLEMGGRLCVFVKAKCTDERTGMNTGDLRSTISVVGDRAGMESCVLLNTLSYLLNFSSW